MAKRAAKKPAKKTTRRSASKTTKVTKAARPSQTPPQVQTATVPATKKEKRTPRQYSLRDILLFPLRLVWRVLYVVLRIMWILLFPLRPVLRPAVRYLRGVRQEFGQVVWPRRREAWKLTFAVVIFSVVFVLVVQLLDYGLRYVFERFII